MAKLRTLEQAEADARLRYVTVSMWQPTDIACPNCGEALEGNHSVTLTIDPPRMPVRCASPECAWSGSIAR